ncbi:hypothetical protein TCK1_230 [Pseudomonas monteilii]|uniref:Uncharacterized protein n=1 Tax=Pseudomonas monteilii TaxID=76759 RepID=A0AAE6R814_9PSED|nr:hypothetical protein TCK1_230 [Pseudomonas monteilii]
MPHTKPPRTAQNRQRVIDEKAARRLKTDIRLQRIPELRALFRVAIIVRADQPLEIRRQLYPLQFQRQRITMRIGNHHHPLAGLANRRQESVGIRPQGNQVGDFLLQLANRQAQLAAPEVQAIPVQRAGIAFEQRLQLHFRHGPAYSVQLGIALGQVLQPEAVVVVQVEQGAVHVQQDGIDGRPGKNRHGKLSFSRQATV